MVSLKTITSLSIYNKIKNGKYALTKCSDKKRESESYIICVYAVEITTAEHDIPQIGLNLPNAKV